MLLIRTELRASPLHGVGCFTLESIKANQPVWIYDERIDLRFRANDLDDFPKVIQEFLLMHGYKEIHDGVEVIVLCGDNSKYMNHSLSPNLIEGSEDHTFINVAAFDIDPGEELTCNYFDFDLDAGRKLGTVNN